MLHVKAWAHQRLSLDLSTVLAMARRLSRSLKAQVRHFHNIYRVTLKIARSRGVDTIAAAYVVLLRTTTCARTIWQYSFATTESALCVGMPHTQPPWPFRPHGGPPLERWCLCTLAQLRWTPQCTSTTSRSTPDAWRWNSSPISHAAPSARERRPLLGCIAHRVAPS
jgi:hypothetical protein